MDGLCNRCPHDVILSVAADVILLWPGVGVKPLLTLLLADDDFMRSSLFTGAGVTFPGSLVGLVFNMGEAKFCVL